MSFVIVSKIKNENINVIDEDVNFHSGRQEDDIESRVKQELDRLRPIILAEAQSSANESAIAELNPLKQKLQRSLSIFAEMNTQLNSPLAQKEKYLADLIIDIAFKLSHHIVGVHIEQDKIPLLNLVTKLLNEIKNEHSVQKEITIRLSALDLPFIQSHMSETNISLITDSNIEPGGAILELASDNKDSYDIAIWDAQLKSRFEVLQKTLWPSAQVAE